MTISLTEGFYGQDIMVLCNPRTKIDPLPLFSHQISFKCKTHVFPLFPTWNMLRGNSTFKKKKAKGENAADQ